MIADSPSRRSVLTALAAVPAASVPALAGVADTSEPDPIFLAIEMHRDAYNRDDDTLGEEEAELFWELIETKPTTIAGLSAFFSYLLTTYYVQDDSHMDGTVNTIFETTAEALKELSANVGQG
jgi:hypothetical protein